MIERALAWLAACFVYYLLAWGLISILLMGH
jgi:hypothetical protein